MINLNTNMFEIYPTMQKMFEGEKFDSLFEVGTACGGLMEGCNVRVGGIDIIEPKIGVAKKNFPEYADDFIVFDAAIPNWPFKDNSYDIVFSCGTLLLIEDPTITIKEMIRIAKKKIIIAEYYDEKEDAMGRIKEGHERFHRNYYKLFKNLNLKIKHKGHITGKDIFVYKK